MCVCCITSGRSFYVAGDQFVDVGVSLRGRTSVMFQVKAAANASVALTAGKHNFTDGAMYEVVLGIEDNTRTIIRWENSEASWVKKLGAESFTLGK